MAGEELSTILSSLIEPAFGIRVSDSAATTSTWAGVYVTQAELHFFEAARGVVKEIHAFT